MSKKIAKSAPAQAGAVKKTKKKLATKAKVKTVARIRPPLIDVLTGLQTPDMPSEEQPRFEENSGRRIIGTLPASMFKAFNHINALGEKLSPYIQKLNVIHHKMQEIIAAFSKAGGNNNPDAIKKAKADSKPFQTERSRLKTLYGKEITLLGHERDAFSHLFQTLFPEIENLGEMMIHADGIVSLPTAEASGAGGLMDMILKTLASSGIRNLKILSNGQPVSISSGSLPSAPIEISMPSDSSMESEGDAESSDDPAEGPITTEEQAAAYAEDMPPQPAEPYHSMVIKRAAQKGPDQGFGLCILDEMVMSLEKPKSGKRQGKRS